MKVLYFDCSSGAAGDMLLAAMLDLLRDLSGADGVHSCVSFDAWQTQMHELLKLEHGGRVAVEPVVRGGMAALKLDFFAGHVHADLLRHVHSDDQHSHDSADHGQHSHDHHDHTHHTHDHKASDHHHDHHHDHRHLKDILALLQAQQELGVMRPQSVALSKRIFEIIGVAEAKVHGIELGKVHFHEVGAFDSIMDIAGFAAAMSLLHVDAVYASPVTLGSGQVQTDHGLLTVPPPAVLEIVKVHEIPTSGLALPGECLTPTGAGILAAIVETWGEMPALKQILGQGAGAGTREIAVKPNVVRVVYGETSS